MSLSTVLTRPHGTPPEVDAGGSNVWTVPVWEHPQHGEIKHPGWSLAVTLFHKDGGTETMGVQADADGSWEVNELAVLGSDWTATDDLAVQYTWTKREAPYPANAASFSFRTVTTTRLVPAVTAANAKDFGPNGYLLQVEKDLKAVEETISTIGSGGGVTSYSIGGRSLSKMDVSELNVLRQRLRRQVREERGIPQPKVGLTY